MIVIVLLFVVYILSVVYFYRYIKIVYSDKGFYSDYSPAAFDFIFMLIPIINTIMAIVMWSDSPYNKKYLKSKPIGSNLWDVIFNTKKTIITEEEKILIETYKQGHNDEIHEKPELSNLNPLLFRIYKLGREDEYNNTIDDQSDEEIIKKIRNFLKNKYE